MTCEFMTNPLGIDVTIPRLSWMLESDERGAAQTAYHILVASSEKILERNQGDIWDSSKQAESQSALIPYNGQPLKSRQICFWKVMVWDEKGSPSKWSDTAKWEMGLLDNDDWRDASWIQLAEDTRRSPLSQRAIQAEHMPEPKPWKSFPSPLFRHTVTVSDKIVRARAYICGLGYHELFINGHKISDHVLDPGQTTYDVHAFYVTHDITHVLHHGVNAIGAMVGNGFYGQNMAFAVDWLAWGPPALIAKIVIDYANGQTEVIGTNNNWRAETGPIVYDNVYAGESYDASRERQGWTLPEYDDSNWQNAKRINPVSPKLIAQKIPPIKRIRTIKPTNIFQNNEGKWIIDLGQNIAGWMKIKVKEAAGAQITMRHAELLTPDGQNIDPASSGVFATGVIQTCIYVCEGNGEEIWEPRFTYHGFRYVEVTGVTHPPTADTFEGVLVHSSVEPRGSFTCSDHMLNQIYSTSMWTIEDNLHSISEDCPHREKCGWLGDAHVVGETDIFNFDMAQFWTKCMDDIETTLGRDGAHPGIPSNISVGRRLCGEANPDWGAAVVLLPWDLYLYYGDMKPIKDHYPLMKRWCAYISGRAADHIVKQGYGDWCPPGTNAAMECPVELTSTAYHYASLQIMENAAKLIGNNIDAENYHAEALAFKQAFIARFLDTQTMGFGCQTANAIALRFGLAPDGKAEEIARALVRDVQEKHGGHYSVGIHGARPIYTVLNEYGHDQVVWDMMHKTDYPSYGYIFSEGFTTWPEEIINWPKGAEKPKCSYNHPMQACFNAWFHESVGGIRPVADAPGFQKFELKPHNWQQLEEADVTHQSLYGVIRSHWKKRSEIFLWEVDIPANTSAIVWIPAKTQAHVTESGKHLGETKGLQHIHSEGNTVVVEASAGKYRFEVKA
jgi:alpha-L-rhamnosidase